MEQKLKQRLVGAVVLISLAVIFIPVILEGPDDEMTPRVQDIPAPPQIEYQAEVELPVPARPPGSSAENPATVESPAPEGVVESTPAPAAHKPERPVTAAPVRPPKPASKHTLSAGSWVIQVGSFNQQLNARGLRDRLKKGSFDSHLQEIASGSGTAWRVLVGPFESRAAAEKQRARIISEYHLKGLVTRFKG